MFLRRKTNNNTLTWVEGAVSALCNHMFANKTLCLIIFAGKHINRMPLRKDRELMMEFNFELIKVNSFRFGKAFDWFFNRADHFIKTIGGYTLIAMSNKYNPENLEDIITLFNLPYRYVTPIAVFHNRIWYTTRRLNYLVTTTMFHNNICSTAFGLDILFFLLISVQKFLYYTVFKRSGVYIFFYESQRK